MAPKRLAEGQSGPHKTYVKCRGGPLNGFKIPIHSWGQAPKVPYTFTVAGCRYDYNGSEYHSAP